MTDKWATLHTASREGSLQTVTSLVKNGADIEATTKHGTPLFLAAQSGHKDVVEFFIEAGAHLDYCYSNRGGGVLCCTTGNSWSVLSALKKGANMDAKTKHGLTPLLMAAKEKHKDVVELLINAGAGLNYCSRKKWAVVHYASQNGWLDIVLSLLQKGVNIDAKTDCGYTPLLMAAYYEHKDMVELLINAGANLNCSQSENWTVLHYASWKGWPDIVQSLLKKSVNIEEKTKKGLTPLLLAVKQQHNCNIALLIEAGADLKCFDYSKWIHDASEKGWFEIVQSLLKRGVIIDVKDDFGMTPLLKAACHKHKDIVELFINAGANFNLSDDEDWTLIHYASSNGWSDIVQYLINKGVNINAVTIGLIGGCNPLLLAARKELKDIVELLINAGSDINCCNYDKCTLLQYASSYGWVDIVRFLLKRGVIIDVQDDFGRTPLLLAFIKEHKDIVELLINAGANNCFGDDKWTVLHYASFYGWVDMVQSLLKKQVDVNARSNLDGTSLHIACRCRKIEVVKHLINAGADVNLPNYKGISPLTDVLQTPDIETVRLLINSCAYFKSIDYERLENSSHKEHILKDANLCSQAIINEFNYANLPELYELSLSFTKLPCITKLRIGNDSQVACNVKQSVEDEINTKGHCDLKNSQPIVLQILVVKSFLNYCNTIKKSGIVLQMKR